MLDEPEHITGIAILVVVPGYEFDECAIQSNAGFSIENRREAATAAAAGEERRTRAQARGEARKGRRATAACRPLRNRPRPGRTALDPWLAWHGQVISPQS